MKETVIDILKGRCKMSFILFMLCITGALFLGMILDRVILKIKDDEEEYEYASISFKDKTTPEAVLERLKEILAVNGVIRVYDYYLICGIKNISSLDFRVGWNDINGFSIEKKEGIYVLNPPEPHEIEK